MSPANMTAVFRCDASAKIGAGHVVRCRALADALRRDGWSCSFVCADDGDVADRALAGTGHELILLPRRVADEPEALLARWPDGCALLVVDHYDLGAEFETACRGWAERILAIDDLADRAHDCDFIVEQAPDEMAARYQGLLPDHCRMLTGPRYALLRSQFAEGRFPLLALSERPTDRIFVMFGATDTKALSPMAVEAIMIASDQLHADVVIGSMAPTLGKLRGLAEESAGRIAIHVDEARPATLMRRAGIAIGAAGGNAWERCCMGLPALVVQTSTNQSLYAAALNAAGAARFLGHHDEVGVGDISEALRDVLAAPEDLETMSRASAMMCDGLGAGRVSAALMPEKNSSGSCLELRAATIDDADLLLQWRSHPDVRRHFRNPDAPDLATHRQWLGTVLSQPFSQLELIVMDGVPVGSLRLDYCSEHDAHEVSITVAPSHHGQGIGGAGLGLAKRQMPHARFIADVMSKNDASHRLFQKAGYRWSNKHYVLDPDRQTMAQSSTLNS
jgi:UDP-2,4-diacetamido-2,4,6-trideoxy-beta-L-altropyranose hydrolase